MYKIASLRANFLLTWKGGKEKTGSLLSFLPSDEEVRVQATDQGQGKENTILKIPSSITISQYTVMYSSPIRVALMA